ncbi:RDD family protein [Microbacterium sp. A82]|uniref:RDD family protein n=1 Tax=Microbacterium sp. A82 TaxID=3450452 RepID=UPI003F34462D
MTQLTFGTVAPTSRRAVAYIIDAVIAGGIGIVLSIILSIAMFTAGSPEAILGVLAIGGPLISLVLLGWFIVYTFMQSGTGSIGMRAQGLRLVQETDSSRLGFGRTLLRNIIFGLAAAIIVGYFTPLFDSSGRFQGWHDKVAKSLMMDARTVTAATPAPPTEAMPIPPRPPLPNAAPAAPAAPVAPFMPGLRGTPGLASPIPAPVVAPQPAAPAPAPVVAPQPATPAAPAPLVQPASPATGEETLIAFVPGITQDGPPAATPPTPAQPVPPAPAHPAPADDLGDIEDTRISIPGHRLVFTWDDGTRVTVSRRTLFGRNPSPEDGAVVVPVRDETLSLSKTHFEAAAEPSGGWIMDRHSTNGTVVVRDGHRITCTPGEQTPIRLGDAIEIGDRIVTVGGYA